MTKMSRWAIRCALVGAAISITSCSSKEEEDAPVVCEPDNGAAPNNIACTGLYSDFKTLTIASTARPFKPSAALWSDGYDKLRYIEIPAGTQIDTSNQDEWSFPVGTKVWKEFRFKERKIETRLLWKVAADHWAVAAYVWSEDGKTATRGEGRSLTVAGDSYDVPTLEGCNDCHRGKKDELLGLEAISLAQPSAEGITLTSLIADNLLTAPPAKANVTLDPGVAVLHVNCGVSCHNSTPGAKGGDSSLRLRVGVDEALNKPFDSWELYSTTVNVRTTLPGFNSAPRVVPGDPAKSAILTAMNLRGTGQMPPSTRQVDFNGAAAVEAWIRSLAK